MNECNILNMNDTKTTTTLSNILWDCNDTSFQHEQLTCAYLLFFAFSIIPMAKYLTFYFRNSRIEYRLSIYQKE